jgi:hypothetical protein
MFSAQRCKRGRFESVLNAASFFVLFEGVRFRAEGNASLLFSGPVEAEGGTSVLPRRAGSSGISWRTTLSLVKKNLHRHRAGFEPQRASPFGKRVKAQKYSEKPPGPERRSLSWCPPLHWWWCWRALLAAINIFVTVSLCRPPPHQNCARA